MSQPILNKISKIRRQKNFSQDYVASKLNISQSYYNKIENGKKELTLKRIIDIVKIFDISITELLDYDKEEKPETNNSVSNRISL